MEMEDEEIFDSDEDKDEDDMDDDPMGSQRSSSSASNYSEEDDNNEDEQERGVDYDNDDKDSGYSPEQHKQKILTLINKTAEFKFTINYSLFPDLVPYFWATINEYFQELMELFIISDGWRLTDFLKAAENRNLHSVFRCGYSDRGKIEPRAKHFRTVFQILLDSAKFQWLAPWKTRNTFGLSICIKRQIGGLFLVYYLLQKQPEPPLGVLSTEKQKMHMDSDDSRSIRFFLNDVNKLEDSGNGKELKKEVKLIFLKLHHQGLFEKTMLREDYSLEISSLLLAGSKTDPRLNYFGLLKDVRDKLLYLTYQGIGNTTFRNMLKVAQTLVDNNDLKRKKSRLGKKSSDDNNECQFSNSHSSRSKSTKSAQSVTFQTKLRQRLNQQFNLFQNQYSAPLLNAEKEVTEASSSSNTKSEAKISKSKSPQSATPGSTLNNKAACSKAFNNVNMTENAFPPQRKTEWTVDDVKALKDERDLAVIAFRIVEILRFVTPANPLTTTRLINEMSVDQKAQDLMDKYATKETAYHNKRLSTPSRLLRLSQKGNHRCFETTETKYWMEYISNSKKTSKTVSPSQMLERLRTHDVVETEPALIFKLSEKADTSTFIDGDEEFEFADKDVNQIQRTDPERTPEHGDKSSIASTSGNSAITLTASNRKFSDMPDLNAFWEEEEAITTSSFGDEPPHLSPLSQEDPLLLAH